VADLRSIADMRGFTTGDSDASPGKSGVVGIVHRRSKLKLKLKRYLSLTCGSAT
jgi:hypothetical protein